MGEEVEQMDGGSWGDEGPMDRVSELKRQREEGMSEREERLHEWLKGLDDGVGSMLQYHDVLAAEFEADLTQIAAVRNERSNRGPGLMNTVDPIFWEIVNVQKMGHRMLFARGISRL